MLAFALDKVTRLESQENILEECLNAQVEDSLQNWNYTRNATASCLLYQALLKTDFEGLSVNIYN